MNSADRTVFIGGLQWLDYVHAGPRKAMSMVAEQKRRYLDPGRYAWFAYGPLLAAFRRALNSPDRERELERVIAWAEHKGDWRALAYRDAVDGFLRTVPKRATGIPVSEATWAEGKLRVQMMESLVDPVLPGATPVVLDSRRGKLFKLRANANRATIDACVRGLAVAYERQWALAA